MNTTTKTLSALAGLALTAASANAEIVPVSYSYDAAGGPVVALT